MLGTLVLYIKMLSNGDIVVVFGSRVTVTFLLFNFIPFIY